MSNKYEQNNLGKYDCPEPGCGRKGINGFDNPQALGTHRRHVHNVGVNGPITVELPKRSKKHPKQVKTKWRDAGSKARVAHSPVPRSDDLELPLSTGTALLAISLWDMGAIQQASPSELRGVFDAIIARRQALGTLGTV